MWPTWDPPGSCRPQVGPMLAPINLAIRAVFSVMFKLPLKMGQRWVIQSICFIWILLLTMPESPWNGFHEHISNLYFYIESSFPPNVSPIRFVAEMHSVWKLECGTWYHHPRRLQSVLSRNLRIFKVAMWHFRCHHHLKIIVFQIISNFAY